MKRYHFKDKHTYSRKIKLFAVIGIVIGVICFQLTDSQLAQRLTFGIITITGYISLKKHVKSCFGINIY